MKQLKTSMVLLVLASSAFGQHVHDTSAPAASSASAAPAREAKDGEARTTSTQTNPLANAVAARTPEEQAAQSGFQFQVGLDHYLGAGTFVDPTLYANFSAMLTVAPTYLFSVGKQKLVASGSFRLAYEYTLPDVDTGRRATVYDTRLGVSAPAFFREKLTGIAFSPSVGVILPTSLESWRAGLITNLSVGVSASRSFFKAVDVRLTLGGSRAFYASAQNAAPASDLRDGQGNRITLPRAGEAFTDFVGWNPAWGLNLGVSAQWRATGSILVYASYGFLKSWRNAATQAVDEYTPKALDANGNPVSRVGMGSSDRTVATLGLSYQMNEHYSLDFGVYTVQSPLTADNKNVRFPWLSFGTWADNTTSLYLSLAAAY